MGVAAGRVPPMVPNVFGPPTVTRCKFPWTNPNCIPMSRAKSRVAETMRASISTWGCGTSSDSISSIILSSEGGISVRISALVLSSTTTVPAHGLLVGEQADERYSLGVLQTLDSGLQIGRQEVSRFQRLVAVELPRGASFWSRFAPGSLPHVCPGCY